MQTKQQIQQLLASAGVSPNKRFGQHFLIDLNLMKLLIDSAGIRGSDVVLEVGCGTGSLTEELAERAAKVIAVELDQTLALIAEKQLAKKENVEVINADILQSKNTIGRSVITALQSALHKYPGRLLLVANLPYSVASSVMLNLITAAPAQTQEAPALPPVVADSVYVTVQREVAQRMTASPGSSDYGTLSIFLSATGNIKTIRTLKPTVFWPQPQVDSAMISFVRSKKKASRIHSAELLSEIVGLFMQHRRKMLKACTKFATGKLTKIRNWPQIFEQSCIDPQKRPDQISPDDYIAIANLCHQQYSC